MMNDRRRVIIFLLALLLAGAARRVTAQPAAVKTSNDDENAALRREWESWNEPFKPFRVLGNVYYVGPSGISSFLITTPQGNILIDTGFETTVPRIRESITKLGFRVADTKILLSSHAHLDHTGGHALMKELTGAQIMMSEADAELLAAGGTNDFTPYSGEMKRYRPAKADRRLADGDQVTLGGATLTCHLTPGHTKGCTTWTLDTSEAGKVHHVLFFGSTSILPGVRLVGNPRYPNIAQDFLNTYRKLKELPCDVFLAPHAGFFGLHEKAARLERGEQPNPFVAPEVYQDFIRHAEQAFLEQLERERQKE